MNNDYIRSSIYLSGNKYRLLKDIIPLIKDESRNTFVDLFGGSGCVSLNVVNQDMFSKVIYNDKAFHLYQLQQFIQNLQSWDWKNLDECHYSYPRTKEDYYRMVEDYNKPKDPLLLYMLQTRSNSNMMRFNKKGEWNMTYGERATYSRDKLENHHHLIKNVELCSLDFGDCIEHLLNNLDLKDVVVYCDPPYMHTTATYNENGGWTENDNQTLFEYLTLLHKEGAKVVMSNVFENRGKVHQSLIDWTKENQDEFDVHHLNISYNNSSFRKGKGKTDEIVIVSR